MTDTQEIINGLLTDAQNAIGLLRPKLFDAKGGDRLALSEVVYLIDELNGIKRAVNDLLEDEEEA